MPKTLTPRLLAHIVKRAVQSDPGLVDVQSLIDDIHALAEARRIAQGEGRNETQAESDADWLESLAENLLKLLD